MFAFLTALLPLLGGFTQPLKDWFTYKQETAKADQQYKLAILQSQTEQAKQQTISDSNDLANRLNSTTQQFKQTTFWMLCVPVLFTMLFPAKASTMWSNFNLMPQWFQWLFLAVYSSIWGIPVSKWAAGGLGSFLSGRREYKLNKAAIYAQLKREGVFKGTQEEVAKIERALDAGENE